MYDAKWELPPCKIYIFKQHQKEIKDLVHALGEEDNFDYKMVTLTFFHFFRVPPSMKHIGKCEICLTEYMEPDDPLQHWRKKVPKGVNLSYTKWKRTLTMKCTTFVRLTKKVEAGKELKNTMTRARQLVAFCTRIKPIHILLWNILLNRIPRPLPKGPPQGVSTFCHLEGVPDKDAIDFLTLVMQLFFGSLSS